MMPRKFLKRKFLLLKSSPVRRELVDRHHFWAVCITLMLFLGAGSKVFAEVTFDGCAETGMKYSAMKMFSPVEEGKSEFPVCVSGQGYVCLDVGSSRSVSTSNRYADKFFVTHIEESAVTVKVTRIQSGTSAFVAICSWDITGATRTHSYGNLATVMDSSFTETAIDVQGDVVSILVIPTGSEQEVHLEYVVEVVSGHPAEPATRGITSEENGANQTESSPATTTGFVQGRAASGTDDNALTQSVGGVATSEVKLAGVSKEATEPMSSLPSNQVKQGSLVGTNGLIGTNGTAPSQEGLIGTNGVAPVGSNTASKLPGSPSTVTTTLPGSSAAVPSQMPSSTNVFSMASSGQCLVTSTVRFPEIRLRCGVSTKDEITHVKEDFLANCPLTAGDSVNVQIVEGQREMQITGRASGGQWCSSTFQPGYYTGPCLTEKLASKGQSRQVKTAFYQGRKVIATVQPSGCEPRRLDAGIYRVIVTDITSGGGQKGAYLQRETGIRLEGQPMIGDLTNLLPPPIEQR